MIERKIHLRRIKGKTEDPVKGVDILHTRRYVQSVNHWDTRTYTGPPVLVVEPRLSVRNSYWKNLSRAGVKDPSRHLVRTGTWIFFGRTRSSISNLWFVDTRQVSPTSESFLYVHYGVSWYTWGPHRQRRSWSSLDWTNILTPRQSYSTLHSSTN